MLTLVSILFIGALIINVVAGLVFTAYDWFNVGVTSIVIIANLALLLAIAKSNIHDAYKIGLSSLFPILALIEFILGIVCPPVFADNWAVIVIMALLLFEIASYIIVQLTNNHNQI